MIPKALAVAVLACGIVAATGAFAQAKEIKIGVIYDLHRPVRGRRLGAAVPRHQDRDRHDQRAGGVEGYKIEPIYADAQ